MPFIQIQTNKKGINTEVLLAKLSALVSEILGKPERFVMVQMKDAQNMLFGGTNDPLAYIELKSIGLPKSETKQISLALCTFMQKELQIDQARVYIEFADADRSMWGWNGTTFER